MKMVDVKCVAVLVLFVTFSAEAAKVQRTKGFGRIIGGRDAEPGEFPYQVSLQYFGSHICGGSIVDARHVLTAGHCASGIGMAYVSVVAGTVLLSDSNRIERDADVAFVHEKFDDYYLFNDVAIIRILGEFPLDGVNLAAATLQTVVPPSGTIVTVSGWGYVAQHPNVLPDHLQAVDLPFISTEDCIVRYSNYTEPDSVVTTGMICAGPIEGGKDSCNGDSGGPLTVEGVLTGLVSWGDVECAIPYFPRVYTDVVYFGDWIRNTLANSNAAGKK